MSDETNDQPAPPESPVISQVVGHTIQRAVHPHFMEKEQIVALPEGWTIEDIDKHCARPSRPKGIFHVPTLEAVKALVKRFTPRNPEDALGFLNLKTEAGQNWLAGGVAVCLDLGSAASGIGHSDFRVDMPFVTTAPFKTFIVFQRNGGDHKALVNFLNPMLAFLVDPDAGTIMDSLLKLKLNKEIKFARAEDQSNGDVAFSIETITGGASASGRVRLPPDLTFTIPVFSGIPVFWNVKVDLRYVLRDDNVRFSLYHPDVVDNIESSFLPALLNEVRGALDPVQVHRGVFVA